MRCQWPMVLTAGRVTVIPIMVAVYYLPWRYAHLAAALIFALAALTDWLDGFLARRWHQTSNLGAFLDPVADKLIVVSGLLLMTAHYHAPVMTVASIVIICREILVSALREWMAHLGKDVHVRVLQVAKIKTTLQLLAISVLMALGPVQGRYLLPSPWFGYLEIVGYSVLMLAVTLTLWSMCRYLHAVWKASAFS